jgi:hypothetical protein
MKMLTTFERLLNDQMLAMLERAPDHAKRWHDISKLLETSKAGVLGDVSGYRAAFKVHTPAAKPPRPSKSAERFIGNQAMTLSNVIGPAAGYGG